MGIKPFSQCSQIKVEPKEMPALLIDFSFAPLGLAVQEGHMCEKPVHQMRISQASVFLAARSRRTPSLLSFCLMVHHHLPREIGSSMQRAPGALLQMQTALQTWDEVGAPHTLNHLCCHSN